MQKPKVVPVLYHVFRCPKCGKWTYTKQSLKVRKCGLCQAQIQIFRSPVIVVEKVSNAHKLVQEKNLGWQQQKGIQLSECSPSKSGSINKLRLTEPSFELENRTKHFEGIFRKIVQICTSRAMPLHALPIAYFAALYLSVEKIIPFSQFLRFCTHKGWVDQNLPQNMVTIKVIL
jgi:ribosomal protein L37AE/L43A